MGRWRPSLLVLRVRPARLPRRITDADRTTLRQFAHQLATLQRELRALQYTDQMHHDDFLIASSLRAAVGEVQRAYRDVVRVVEGMRAREVPGFDADAKQTLIKTVNKIAEEFKDVRTLRTKVEALEARAVGDDHA